MRNIAYSELIVLGHSVLENVDRLAAEGSDRIELMMDAAGWDAHRNNYKALVAELKARGLDYSVHPAAWDINLTAEIEILRAAAYRHHLDALEFCAALGASQMVLHPGFVGSPCFSRETAKKRAFENTCKLAETAKGAGVRLAFENVGYNGQSIYTMDEYVHALDGVDSIAGYLVDTGHANINGWDIPLLIRSVSGRLFGLHIHDNHGKADSHLPIGHGNCDWSNIYAAMREIENPACEFILEYAPGLPLKHLSQGKTLLEANL